MSKDLRAQMILRLRDRFSGPMRKVRERMKGVSDAARQTADRLKAAGRGSERFASAQRRVSESARRTTEQIKRQQKALERLGNRYKRHRNQALKKTAAAGAAGIAAGYAGRRGLAGFMGTVETLRPVARAEGDLATLGLEKSGIERISQRGASIQKELAGMTRDTFLRASYDIRSGISSLNDQGVADMTAAAAYTAKATKGQLENMTSLFATGYGVFRNQFADLSDSAFGDRFASTLAASVKQFKTDGGKMQQAIESATAAAANLGMAMEEQFAVLGMLQQKMQPGEAGTALKAFASKLVEAQEDLGIEFLDAKGRMLPLVTVLENLKARYGATLDAFERNTIQKAFGSEEAIKLIDNLYGQEAALRENAKALRGAGEAGLSYVRTMAQAANTNMDARLSLASQQWLTLRQNLAEAFLPALEAVLPKVVALTEALSSWVQANPQLAEGLGWVILGVSALLAVLGPVVATISSVLVPLILMRYGLAMLGLRALSGGRGLSFLASMFGRLKGLKPLSWALLIPKFAWKTLITPLRWAGLVGGVLGRFSWGLVIKPLSWVGLKLIPSLRWSGLVGSVLGRFSWGLVIKPLSWAALKVIPYIGWAALAADIGLFAWNLVIKPLGWDEYIPLEGLKKAWNRVSDWISTKATEFWDSLPDLTGWFSSHNEAARAADNHKSALDELTGSAGATLEALNKMSAEQRSMAKFEATQGIKEAQNAIKTTMRQITHGHDWRTLANLNIFPEGDRLIDRFKKGQITLEGFSKSLQEIYETEGRGSDYAAELLETTKDLVNQNAHLKHFEETLARISEFEATPAIKRALPLEKPERALETPLARPQETLQEIKQVREAAASLPQSVRENTEKARAHLASLDWASHGLRLMQTLASGITNGGGVFKSALSNELAKARALLPSSNAKEGPLSNLTGYGRAILSTIGKGVMQAGDTLAQPLATALSLPQPLPAAIPQQAALTQGGKSNRSITVNATFNITGGDPQAIANKVLGHT